VKDSYITYFANDPNVQPIPYFTVLTNGLAAPVKISILTKSGTVVIEDLYTGGSSSGGTFDWSMKDSTQQLVPTGKYKFRVVVAGDKGTQYEGQQQGVDSPLFMVYNYADSQN